MNQRYISIFEVMCRVDVDFPQLKSDFTVANSSSLLPDFIAPPDTIMFTTDDRMYYDLAVAVVLKYDPKARQIIDRWNIPGTSYFNRHANPNYRDFVLVAGESSGKVRGMVIDGITYWSIIDIFAVICATKQPWRTWNEVHSRVLPGHLMDFCKQASFLESNNNAYVHHVFTCKGVIYMIGQVNSKHAKQFILQMIDVFIRFQAGDRTLIAQIHENATSSNPFNVMARDALTEEQSRKRQRIEVDIPNDNITSAVLGYDPSELEISRYRETAVQLYGEPKLTEYNLQAVVLYDKLKTQYQPLAAIMEDAKHSINGNGFPQRVLAAAGELMPSIQQRFEEFAKLPEQIDTLTRLSNMRGLENVNLRRDICTLSELVDTNTRMSTAFTDATNVEELITAAVNFVEAPHAMTDAVGNVRQTVLMRAFKYQLETMRDMVPPHDFVIHHTPREAGVEYGLATGVFTAINEHVRRRQYAETDRKKRTEIGYRFLNEFFGVVVDRSLVTRKPNNGLSTMIAVYVLLKCMYNLKTEKHTPRDLTNGQHMIVATRLLATMEYDKFLGGHPRMLLLRGAMAGVTVQQITDIKNEFVERLCRIRAIGYIQQSMPHLLT
jgi:hypothetical protein